MTFEPRPYNDFPRFIDAYYQRCKAACPQVLAIAGKWNLDDLIPGMSDFDARLIVSNDTSIDDWCAMSLAVGEIHTDLVRRHPHWARLLEHLPGLNLTRAEMTDPTYYYPEFQQWTFHEGDAATIAAIRDYLTNKPWSQRDELFHLKKFAAYYGPYDRNIDKPINLGPFESKYPLHSRFMHYFAPPLMSAVSIIERRGVGKFQALHSARYLFPEPDTIALILDTLERHYETPDLYSEQSLVRIEEQLDRYLRNVAGALTGHVTLVKLEPGDAPAALKAKVKALPVDMTEQFYEGVRFGRLMKGRLLFYAEVIPWFESEALIDNEIRRMPRMMFETPLRTYGQLRFGVTLTPQEVLERLTGELIDATDAQRVRDLVALCRATPPSDQMRAWAAHVAELYEPTLRLAERLGPDLRHRLDSYLPSAMPRSAG